MLLVLAWGGARGRVALALLAAAARRRLTPDRDAQRPRPSGAPGWRASDRSCPPGWSPRCWGPWCSRRSLVSRAQIVRTPPFSLGNSDLPPAAGRRVRDHEPGAAARRAPTASWTSRPMPTRGSAARWTCVPAARSPTRSPSGCARTKRRSGAPTCSTRTTAACGPRRTLRRRRCSRTSTEPPARRSVTSATPLGVHRVMQTFYLASNQPNVLFGAARVSEVYFPSGGLQADRYGTVRSPILLEDRPRLLVGLRGAGLRRAAS